MESNKYAVDLASEEPEAARTRGEDLIEFDDLSTIKLPRVDNASAAGDAVVEDEIEVEIEFEQPPTKAPVELEADDIDALLSETDKLISRA